MSRTGVTIVLPQLSGVDHRTHEVFPLAEEWLSHFPGYTMTDLPLNLSCYEWDYTTVSVSVVSIDKEMSWEPLGWDTELVEEPI